MTESWLWQGVAANIVTTLLYAAVGFATLGVYFIVNRRRLMRFFGVGENGKAVRILLSRLDIQPKGALGHEEVRVGYTGPAIIRIEYQGALLVAELFRSTVVARLPGRFQEWLKSKRLTLVPVQPVIDVSPCTFAEVDCDNLILIGSGIYNTASSLYLNPPWSRFTFDRTDTGERVLQVHQAGVVVALPGRSVGNELAVVERLRDGEQGRIVFVCAGLGASSSFGAARYLAKNWRALQRRYGDEVFAICLAFPGQDSNSEVVVDEVVLP